MRGNLIRIIYETSPEKVDRLSKRLMPVAESIKVRESGTKIYLEVAVKDDIFDVSIRKKGIGRIPSAAVDKESGKGITIASAYRYLYSHSMDELVDYTDLSKTTCYKRIALYKKEGSWREDNDLLYF